MSRIQRMMSLAGEIRVMINSRKHVGPDIAARLAVLTEEGREAIGVQGNVDVTYHEAQGEYVMTLSRPSTRNAKPLNASIKMLQASPDHMAPPIHLDVVWCLNRLDAVLTQEERTNARQ